jgi:hypothetical protein
MGTKKQAIIPSATNVEVLPQTDLPGLPETLIELRTALDDLPEMLAVAEQMDVLTKPQYVDAGSHLNKIRALRDLAEQQIRPYLDKVNDVRTFLLGVIKKHELACADADKIMAAKMADYNRREREEAERETQRKNQELKERQEREAKERREREEKAAEERKQRRIAEIRAELKAGRISKRQAEKMLRDAGAAEEADKARAAAEAEEARNKPITPVVVQPDKVAVAGLRARSPIVYEITNIDAIPRHLLYPNRNQQGGFDHDKFPRLNEMVKKAKSPEAAEAEANGGICCRRDDRV